MEVNNYPMKARTNEEAKELENVINQRKIEIEDIKVREAIGKSSISLY